MLKILMKTKRAAFRVNELTKVLDGGKRALYVTESKSDGHVNIGDTKVPVKVPDHPLHVPYGFVPSGNPLPQSTIRHLRWMAQKDLLGQDIFLIGPPGPLRRFLTMQYLELTRKEVEYIALSRDTTESDLKQRREIKSGTSYYIDQCAVRAALLGRVLVIEGVEKAERNVLPALNNLLENREMQLDDGRFLMHHIRYDKLLEQFGKESMDSWQLVRVSDKFRVIALGLPVPKYRGNPLDPPLRSRFQARDIYHLSFKDQLDVLYEHAPNVESNILAQILSCANTLATQESASLGLPDFPLENLVHAVKILDKAKDYPLLGLFSRLYPYDILLNKEGQQSVSDAYSKFEIKETEKDDSIMNITSVQLNNGQEDSNTNGSFGNVTLDLGSSNSQLKVPCGKQMKEKTIFENKEFVMTDYHRQLLADVVLTHSTMDFCIIGGKGCGKTTLVKQFANMLGYLTEPVLMYQDMTARDLLQQRYTSPNGDTVWRYAPLVEAALDGRIAVLDGLHRVNPGTLSVLQRLVHDRELTLHDGTRLTQHDKYDDMKNTLELTENEMRESGVLRIHPSFRIIALAEPPKAGSPNQQWLNPEMLTLFLYHKMPPLSTTHEMEIIQEMVPGAANMQMSGLLELCHHLRNSSDTNIQSIASSLSTRQLLRISKRLKKFLKVSGDSDKKIISDAVHKACLSRFLPQLARTALCDALQKSKLPSEGFNIAELSLDDISCEIKDGNLRIGETVAPVYKEIHESGSSTAKVPDIIFYDNAQHLSVMQDMLQDYILGEHILLVGNQGVGKNKIVDRFLHLLNKPREYLQLHRDTTVQSLTVQPTVRDGTIVYEDSPLVRAVRLGHALVVDEADKAPTHVTCVLKNLLESGRATLADGRKIVSDERELENLLESHKNEDVIIMHPDFRMFVLANRPGFPFLGNDFFAAMGDVFSCHAVDNPSVESELKMLQQYGEDVPVHILKKLVASFGELRDMADQGLISYPYSTREVVNIVKHLQEFPKEGLASVVRNVFDFDAYSTETREQVESVMHKHGIPIGARPQNVNLSNHLPIPPPKLSGYWTLMNEGKKICKPEVLRPEIKGPIYLNVQNYDLERIEDRALTFTEQRAHWQIPNLSQVSIISDIAITKDPTSNDQVHVAVVNSPALYSHQHGSSHIKYMDLFDVFPNAGPSFQSIIRIAPLGNPLRGQVVLFEEKTNIVLVVDTDSGSVRRLVIPGLDRQLGIGSVSNLFRTSSSSSSAPASYKMCSDHSNEFGSVVFYQLNGQKLYHVDLIEGQVHKYDVPFFIGGFHMTSHNKWLMIEAETNRKFLLTGSDEDILPSKLKTLKEEGVSKGWGNYTEITQEELLATSCEDMSSESLTEVLQQSVSSPNRLIVDKHNFAHCVLGFPDLEAPSEVHSFPRGELVIPEQSRNLFSSPPRTLPPSSCVMLPEIGQVIRIMPTKDTPDGAFKNDNRPENAANCLEIADVKNHKLFYLPVQNPVYTSPYVSWQKSISDSGLVMTSGSGNIVYSVDTAGCVREWETELMALSDSLAEWIAMIGADADNSHMQITSERESGKDVTAPKHGKVDSKNEPHVGGNMWAGGTGGRDTAGLGGKGGPYRLDAGHDVTQIPDWEKEAVPEHVKKAAREMAQKAFQARLREINMSEYDAHMYESFSSSVRRQVKSLRIILDSLQAKGKERQWQRHQMTGELDDMKLIEGLTGEKNIYKRRADQEPEPGTPQQKPKRLRIVVDVSGSMYRFNGLDNRLERSMEAVCMVMEGLEGYKEKFKYDIWGHSGDGYEIELANAEKPPTNNKERLKVMKTMHAHAQFCMSGDHTLEATEFAIKSVKNEEADEYFVIILSDANLDRYGIRPTRFTEALTRDEEVNAFAIFIGSLGDQAERLKKQLPAGRSFVCMDTKNIPQIMQQIFTSTLLSTR
uniref:von Willebrand factor A domain-containing protein 8-like isoform X1 n=1 Tax=Styela clava TaxID=7725 RepID=UPI001939A7A9|nr:von Willebrand factor A domain-containing protein 8-like isoform X1 [Styela clava]